MTLVFFFHVALRPQKPKGLLGTGEWRWGGRGGGAGGGGGGGATYLSLDFHHQNDFCITMGSDESHFYVFISCEGQSHKTVFFVS